MTPERTAYLRQIATNTMAHGKTWTGPLGEVLMQAADAIRELATEADELAALRIEHAAWGALLDATRADRDAARAALVKEENDHVITLARYERAHEWADSLANQIASAADHEIGEHSNLNDPWDNAQDGLAKLVTERDALRARVAELERAADAARKAERARTLAAIADRRTSRRCSSCDLDLDSRELIEDIERGAHEGAAGGS